MEHLPLFISLASLLLWASAALFMNKRLRAGARSIGLGMALVQLGCAVWAAARVFGDAPVQYSGVWFQLAPAIVFDVKFVVDQTAVVFWLALSVFAAVLAYLALLSQLKGTRSQLRGEGVAVPLIAVGALCTITAANFLSYFFGWALISAIGFLAVGFSAPNRDDRASASMRYLTLNILPEVIFMAGVLGCYAGFGSLSFAAINDKAGGDGPSWAVMCLVAGMMLRNLQLPLMQSARYLAAARASSFPVLFIGHTLLSATLFVKLFPTIVGTDGIQYFALIPAITALSAAVLALPEEDPTQFVCWLVSYVCASVFLSGLAGHYAAALALALTGSVGAFTLANTLSSLGDDDPAKGWLIGFGVLMLTGLPVTGFGWARHLEYVGLFHNEGQVASLHWILLGIKISADMIMAIALWSVLRTQWIARKSGSRASWDAVVPLTILSLASLSAAVGGRIFGGLAGQAELDLYAGAAWFEKLLVPPPGAVKAPVAALELVGADADLFARFLVVGGLILPTLIAGLWLFRDKRSIDEFRAGARNLVSKLGHSPTLDPKLWGWGIRPVSRALGRAAAFFDGEILDYVMADMWEKPARAIRDLFRVIEERIIDRRLIDGLGEAVASIGKSLRLVQNGQVQFYFALGLILMGAVVIKFVVVGG